MSFGDFMGDIYLYTIGSVIAVSLISLVGIFTISINNIFLKKILRFMVSFSAGALLGDAFIHLLPEVIEEVGLSINISLGILGGIITFFVLEKFVRWRHCHAYESQHHHPFVIMNLVGDSLHNLLDGVVIGASFLVSIPAGIATTMAVALHEIPQEIGDFGVLVHGGLSRNRALILNFVTALTALLGAILVLTVGAIVNGFINIAVAFTAGGFIYIAGSDLIPELHKETRISRSLVELLAILLGIAVMVALLRLEI